MEPWALATLVVIHVSGVVALWLRLRWRVRHEQARARTLADLAEALSGGGRVDEARPDGTRLTMTIPPTDRPTDG